MKKLSLFIIAFLCLIISLADAAPTYTVRTIYFLPINTTHQQGIDDRIEELVKGAQQFYLDEMDRHGYSPKTFKLETDGSGDLVVHRVNGKYSNQHYYQNGSSLVDELPQQFRTQNNIALIFIEGGPRVRPGVCGLGWDYVGTGISSGFALVPADGDCLTISVVAHELGHTFGLRHNNSDNTYLMGAGTEHLARCEVEWLDVHHYFNASQTLNAAPTITRRYPLEVVEDDNVRLKIDLSDTDGLVQAHFYVPTNIELIGCTSLTDHKDTAEIIVPKSRIASDEKVIVQIIDKRGNYYLYDLSTHIIENAPGVTYLSLINGAQPISNDFGLNPKNPSSQWTSWRQPIDDRTNNGNPIVIDGMAFERGISGTPFHESDAIFDYDLTGANYTQFQGYIGLADEHDHAMRPNDNSSCGLGGSVYFTFKIDGKQIYKSQKLTGADAPVKVEFAIPTDAKTLQVRFNSAGDRQHCDTASIGDAKLLSTPTIEPIQDDMSASYPDVNGDGYVNVVDLVLTAARYGEQIVGNPSPNPDVNRDGIVDIDDIILIAKEMPIGSAPSLERLFPETALLPNFPNPFNPETWIPYQLSSPANVDVRIYTVNGELVRWLSLGYQDAGSYQRKSRAVYWDGRNAVGESVASGVYFYTLKAGDFSATRKMLIHK
ncbi:T9SS type A sorting domain-containing protein [Candidatus Poribacteria bacterium]|nr:T9SS type A sorting domain-containing protein [Candidatus Poribacteria bacterium]MYH80174.1 T9SS type A sorting domain-containing protein [Candidatus Poribacteria bacterium]